MRRASTMTAGLLAGLVLVVALPAAAQTQATEPATVEAVEPHGRHLEELRERVIRQIENRLDRIDRLQARIKDSETVEPQNAAHLTADLSSSQGGLTALLAKTRAASSIDELRVVFESVVYDHRIYALRTPQTGLVLASDFGVAVADRLGSVADTISEAAERAAEAGYDVSEVEAMIAEAEAITDDALAVVEPVAETVLPLEPADVPDPSRAILEQAHSDMLDGRETYRAAHGTLRDAARLLADIVGRDAA